MPENVPNADELLVAVHGPCALVVVHGRGNFKMGPALKQFCSSSIDSGSTRVILDMDGCVGMDSTFMGVLAGLALRFKDEGSGGRVVMMNVSPKILELLTTLGLDRLIHTHGPDEADEDLQADLACVIGAGKLEIGDASERTTLGIMLAAHENLVRSSPENLPKFKNVLDYLSQDLETLDSK